MPKASEFGIEQLISELAVPAALRPSGADEWSAGPSLLLFRHDDLRRPHDTVVQLEAALDDIGYRVFRLIRARLLHDRFMTRGSNCCPTASIGLH